jgi:site-specific recombinase XerD
LAPFVDGYRTMLEARGYTPGTVRNMLQVLGHLGRWMQTESVDLSELNATRLAEFRAFRGERWRRSVDRAGLRGLVGYLVEQGVAPRQPDAVPDALDELIAQYRSWLADERGLEATTILRYARTARIFLAQRDAGARVEDLTGAQVHRFLVAEARRCSVGAAKGRVAELRALLRFLFATGRILVQLGAAVPPVAGWHDTGLTPTLSADAVTALLASCDQATPMGVRDYVILLLLARMGLRSIEVVRLRLEDVHWRAGEITVRGKARRLDRMPLPHEVGAALSSYVTGARPQSVDREVFLSCRAPLRPLPAAAIGDIVQRACRHSGTPVVGAHRLRHALATSMVAAGVPIADISQVLRHRDLATTALYAKVDVAALRLVAKPWPGSAA